MESLGGFIRTTTVTSLICPPNTPPMTKADITRLADKFKAWKVTFGVEPEHWGGAISRCEELGLFPDSCGGDEENGLILVRALVPSVPPNEEYLYVTGPFPQEIEAFHGKFIEAKKMELICPPHLPTLRPLIIGVPVIDDGDPAHDPDGD